MFRIGDVKLGQEVVVSGRHGEFGFGYFVTKISPSGQITVLKGDSDKIVFNANGDERSSDKWFKRYLHTNVQEIREDTRKERAQQIAAHAIQNIGAATNDVKRQWGKDSLELKIAELESLLAAAKEKVSKI